jgi:hypothetical protein
MPFLALTPAGADESKGSATASLFDSTSQMADLQPHERRLFSVIERGGEVRSTLTVRYQRLRQPSSILNFASAKGQRLEAKFLVQYLILSIAALSC